MRIYLHTSDKSILASLKTTKEAICRILNAVASDTKSDDLVVLICLDRSGQGWFGHCETASAQRL